MTSPSIVNVSDPTVDRALAACAHPLDGDCIVPTTAYIAGLVRAALITLCGAAPHAITPAATEQCRQSAAVDAGLEEQPRNRRPDVILRAARAEAADLVALSTPFRNTWDAALTRRLLDTGIAVLIVPPPQGRPIWRGRIGIAHDGSRNADGAMSFVRRVVDTGGERLARVDIVHVDDSASAANESDCDVVESRREAVIEWWLSGLLPDSPAHVDVRPLRPVGDPARELAALSEDLDLLVIGTRGRAPLRRALTGSTSRALTAMTRCPLLIVPPG